MDKFKSKLTFNRYIVNSVNFINNDKYNGKPVALDVSIGKNVAYDGKNMVVTLIVELFKDIPENYPFKMSVVVQGIFTVENNEEHIDYEPNAVAILYPYVRAIVSTYTANANVNPVLLPPINVNKLIDSQKNDTNVT